jgi:hypothetical protein
MFHWKAVELSDHVLSGISFVFSDPFLENWFSFDLYVKYGLYVTYMDQKNEMCHMAYAADFLYQISQKFDQLLCLKTDWPTL